MSGYARPASNRQDERPRCRESSFMRQEAPRCDVSATAKGATSDRPGSRGSPSGLAGTRTRHGCCYGSAMRTVISFAQGRSPGQSPRLVAGLVAGLVVGPVAGLAHAQPGDGSSRDPRPPDLPDLPDLPGRPARPTRSAPPRPRTDRRAPRTTPVVQSCPRPRSCAGCRGAPRARRCRPRACGPAVLGSRRPGYRPRLGSRSARVCSRLGHRSRGTVTSSGSGWTGG